MEREHIVEGTCRIRTGTTAERASKRPGSAIMQESGQTLPARERVADCFGQRAAAGYKGKLRFEPEPHGID